MAAGRYGVVGAGEPRLEVRQNCLLTHLGHVDADGERHELTILRSAWEVHARLIVPYLDAELAALGMPGSEMPRRARVWIHPELAGPVLLLLWSIPFSTTNSDPAARAAWLALPHDELARRWRAVAELPLAERHDAAVAALVA